MRPLRLKSCQAFATCCLAVVSHSGLHGQHAFSIGTGVDYSIGDYGTDHDYEFTSLPLILTYKHERWRAEVTFSMVELSGPDNSLIIGDGGVILGVSDKEKTETGIGDIKTEITYQTDWIPEDWFALDLTTKFKLPTADESKGLGTGEFDYTLQCDLFKTIGSWTPMAFIAYKFRGEPDGRVLNDVWNLSAGLNYALSSQTNLGFIYEYQEPNSEDEDAYLEIEAYWTYTFDARWKLIVYADKGFTDAAPNYSGGLEIHYRL